MPLVPRLFFHLNAMKVDDLSTQLSSAPVTQVSAIMLQTIHEPDAMTAKKNCLYHDIDLHILGDPAIALAVNAAGLLLNFEDGAYDHIHHVQNEVGLIGVKVESIDQLAEAYDEGIVDYVLIDSVNSYSDIIDDARILGYHVPIVILDVSDIAHAHSLLSRGVYGLITEDINLYLGIKNLLDQYPIRG